jgi:tRNA dimethylallyltransferase
MNMGMAVPGGADKGASRRRAVLIAGPTCSGKSALALAIAGVCEGVVINADSMQVYRELRILTARPAEDDERAVPHALYGVRQAAEGGDAAWWLGAAISAMESAWAAGRVPVLCGGTGLYFSALTGGLAAVPVVAEAVRAEARELLAELGAEALHARLAMVDPVTAGRLRARDGQRVARAWEVWAGTGRGLAAWQDAGSEGGATGWDFRAFHVDPPRAELRAASGARCEAMVGAGVLQEVAAIWALDLDPALPAMRAHGVREFGAYLSGEISLEAAVARTAMVTGQYTKRQATWFRHHDLAEEGGVRRILARVQGVEQFSASQMADMRHFVLGDD